MSEGLCDDWVGIVPAEGIYKLNKVSSSPTVTTNETEKYAEIQKMIREKLRTLEIAKENLPELGKKTYIFHNTFPSRNSGGD